MPALSDVVTEVLAKLIPLGHTTRWGSDYRTDMNTPLLEGAQDFQLQAQYQATRDARSNVSHAVAAVQVIVFHRLLDWQDERAYTEGAMFTDQTTLLDFTWWRDLASIYIVEGVPDLQPDVTRVGNIINWGVLCTFQITPD